MRVAGPGPAARLTGAAAAVRRGCGPAPAVAARGVPSMAVRRRTLGALVVLLVLVAGLTAPAVSPDVARTAGAAVLPVGTPVVLDGSVTGFTRMGPWVVVAGTFSQVRIDPVDTAVAPVTINRPRLFAYDAATGLFDPAFQPYLNGAVLALAGDATGVYVGGAFTTANGLPHRKLVRLLPDGSVDTSFSADADNRVQALALRGDRLFVGGQFTVIRGSARTRLAQLDAATGRVSRSFNLALTGTAGAGGTASVQTLAVSPDGKRLLVAHTAQRIAGKARYGVALVDLSGQQARLDPWRTDLWQSRLAQTGGLVRVTSAAWGPDGSWFVVTNTGGDKPPINDSVQRFDVPASPTSSPVAPTWVTRMFDSTYSSAVGPDGSVYVGGHFQFTEAPGAADPYPGDPAVNYGGGLSTQGARTLGQQVVNRQQVGALDPATGQATNWWSSANGHQGVLALMVSDGRVLIGTDGGRIGGQQTGRAGSAPAADAPDTVTVPTSTVTSPVNGANLDVGPITLTGTTSAPSGVAEVKVEVSGAGGYEQLPAFVTDPGDVSTTWSLDLVLPDPGDYVLKVKTWGQDPGEEQVTKTVWHLLTNDPTNAPPTTTWTYPHRYAASFASSTFTVTGTATDPDGVDAVALTFYNRGQHSYVGADGELDPFVTNLAQLASPGSASTTWSLTVTLPDGDYTAYAKGTDLLGTTDPRGTELRFSLFPGNDAPSVSITDAPAGSRRGAFTLRGRASDDDSLARVVVKVADLRYGLGAQPTGTFGVARWITATRAHPHRARTTWSVRIPGLPAGTYRVTVAAYDGDGVVTPAGKQAHVTVRRWPRGAKAEPRTTITSPTASTRFPGGLDVSLGGTARYAPGVTKVTYSLFDTALEQYLQGDGSFAVTPFAFPADLAPGAGTRSWSADTVLPHTGTWRLDAVGHGRGGAVDSTPAGSRTLLYVYPGDDDATVTVNSPADGDTLAPPQAVTVSGRAFDDHGVIGVQVRVSSPSGDRGVRTDLTVGAHPAWLNAFVTNTGGTSTNFNLVTPTLPKGTWLVSVRAIDSVGKPQALPDTRSLVVKAS